MKYITLFFTLSAFGIVTYSIMLIQWYVATHYKRANNIGMVRGGKTDTGVKNKMLGPMGVDMNRYKGVDSWTSEKLSAHANLTHRITNTFSYKSLIRVYNKDVAFKDMDLYNLSSMNKLTHQLQRQKSCAIVGNSGVLRNSSCGEDINSNTFVIRCNAPAIRSYEKDVGNKTHLDIIFQTFMLDLYNLSTNAPVPADLVERLSTINNTILWYPESFHSLRVTEKMTKRALDYLKTKFDLQFDFAVTAFPRFTSTMKKVFGLKQPTSGLRTLVAALDLCEHVNVYGFYPYRYDQYGNEMAYHYYGPFLTVANHTKSRHDYPAEYDLLRYLHYTKVLRFVQGNCAD